MSDTARSQPPVPLAEPFLTGNAARYIAECLETNFVSSVGPFVARFETEFARYVGAKHAVACASGTAAIHVGLRLLGVGPGDEVFCSTLTFVASVNAIAYQGATPVLVDSEPRTWNLDAGLVVEELARRARVGAKMPKAVEVVHLLGHPAELDALVSACEQHGVAILEDAAEALGATYTRGAFAGKQVGSIGTLGCFSFNGNKVITTGGGGMLVTDDEGLARRAKHLTTQARLPGVEYRHDEIGYNYRLTNLAAALGVAQLEALPDFLVKKRAIARVYDEAISGHPGVSRPPRADWADPSMWLYTVCIDESAGRTRYSVFQAMANAGIGSRPIWPPVHSLPMYAAAPRLGGGGTAERVFASALSLPSSVQLTAQDQKRVIDELLAHTA